MYFISYFGNSFRTINARTNMCWHFCTSISIKADDSNSIVFELFLPRLSSDDITHEVFDILFIFLSQKAISSCFVGSSKIRSCFANSTWYPLKVSVYKGYSSRKLPRTEKPVYSMTLAALYVILHHKICIWKTVYTRKAFFWYVFVVKSIENTF